MSDIIVAFARLWGQLEATVLTAKDEEISEMLKAYDSEECLNLLTQWKEEYNNTDEDDTCDFFYKKIEELYEKEKQQQ